MPSSVQTQSNTNIRFEYKYDDQGNLLETLKYVNGWLTQIINHQQPAMNYTQYYYKEGHMRNAKTYQNGQLALEISYYE